MGLLVDGVWQDRWYNTKESGGRFVREDAQFRNAVGDEAFPAESGRYHLYVSLACPWAHRALGALARAHWAHWALGLLGPGPIGS